MLVASGCAATSATLDAPNVDGEPTRVSDASFEPEGLAVPEGLALVGDVEPITLVPSVPSELRLAVLGGVVTDPVVASPVRATDMIVVDLLYDGLTVWDEHLDRWRPHIGAVFDVTEDGLVWTIGLDREATFSDGSPIDADAVVASFARVLDDPSTLAASRLDVVRNVVALDESTVVFELASPLAHLPLLLSSPVYGIVPQGDTPTGAVSSGPMVMAGERQLRVLEPGLGLTGVRLVGFDAEQDAVRAMERGELDLVYVSSSHTGPVDASRDSVVKAYVVLHALASELADRDVRQSVVATVDRRALTAAAFGAGAEPLAALLGTEGCGEGCEGSSTDLSDVGPLQVRYVHDAAGREATLATELVDQLVSAGADAVAVASDVDAFVSVVEAGEHDVVRSGWVGLVPWPDSELAAFGSDSGENVAGYANAEVDAALARARLSGERADYDAAAALLDDDAVVIPVARLQIRVLLSPDVEGLLLHHDGTFAVEGLSVRR